MNSYKLNEEDAKALEIEIKILREIHHPYLVDLYDVFRGHDDYVYLVTEKIMGGSLYDRIAKKGRYGEPEARKASKILFEAMAFTHKHDIGRRLRIVVICRRLFCWASEKIDPCYLRRLSLSKTIPLCFFLLGANFCCHVY